MTPETLQLFGMTITILVAMAVMNRNLRTDMQEEFKSVRAEAQSLRTEMQEEFKLMRGEMQEAFKSIRSDMAGLSERMARVEGMIDGLREAIAARIVA